jgi:hypothetical protein
MIEPQRDLHNAQNPGVLVSDPIWLSFNGIFLVRILARRLGAIVSVRVVVDCANSVTPLSCPIEDVWRKLYGVCAIVSTNKLARSFHRQFRWLVPGRPHTRQTGYGHAVLHPWESIGAVHHRGFGFEK